MRRKRKVLISAGIVLILLALGWFFPPSFYRSGQEDDIRAALAIHIASGWKHPCQLTVEDKAPSTALLARLQKQGLDVSAGHRYTTDREGLFIDAETKKPVVVCNVGPIQWTSIRSVTVEGSAGDGMMGGHGGTYTLTRTPDGWVVDAESNSWSS